MTATLMTKKNKQWRKDKTDAEPKSVLLKEKKKREKKEVWIVDNF